MPQIRDSRIVYKLKKIFKPKKPFNKDKTLRRITPENEFIPIAFKVLPLAKANKNKSTVYIAEVIIKNN